MHNLTARASRPLYAATIVLLLSLVSLGRPAMLPADVFTVTKTTDSADGVCDADCSLREAVIAANASPGRFDTIELGNGPYNLTILPGTDDPATGDLDISSDVEIVPVSRAVPIIRTLGIDRLVEVHSGVVTLSGLTFQGGARITGSALEDVGGALRVGVGASLALEDCVVEASAAGTGGGISVFGTLMVSRSVIRNNTANGSTQPGSGGGLHVGLNGSLYMTDSLVDSNETESSGGGGILVLGTASVVGSTISNNQIFGGGAEQGAGIRVAAAGSLSLVNSTVSGNGSVILGGGIKNEGSITASNVTITGNTATAAGGGIYNDGTFELRNTLIAGNIGGMSPDCYGTLTSDGYNLIGSLSNCTIAGDLTGVLVAAPELGPLADNGGLTPTHALQPLSPAVDAGDPAGCRDELGAPLSSDQRGRPREMDGDGGGDPRCDLGSFESGYVFADGFESGDTSAWADSVP